MPPEATGYATAAWLYVRAVGVVGVIAFVSLAVQLRGLFGPQGIMPLDRRLARLSDRGRGWRRAPSLLWLDAGPRGLWATTAAGGLASLLVAADVATVPALMVMFACYLSFVNVGTPFLSYQWDVLLLEATAAAVPAALAGPPAWVAVALLWVLSIRLVLTSGVVKLQSGDRTWRDGTAMTHHFRTQPLPTRWGWWAHQLPDGLLGASTRAVLFVELVVPPALLLPWPARVVPVVVLALLQVAILLTGNYGFFNLLALALLVPLVPDGVWDPLVGGLAPAAPAGAAAPVAAWVATAAAAGLLALNVLWLARLAGGHRWVRRVLRAVAPWRLSSPYGLFASMTTSRPQLVVEGTRDGHEWHAYRFRFQAVDPDHPPRWNAPHQPRLDWQLWFAALRSAFEAPWVGRFLQRLADGSQPVRRLLAHDPFDGRPPEAVRATVWEYDFTDPSTRRRTGRWWTRERLGAYHRPVRGSGSSGPPGDAAGT